MLGILLGIASAAIGIISSVATVVGTAVATVAKALAVALPSLETLKSIGMIICGIGNLVGVLNAGDDVEEIGAKTMQEGTRERRPDESAEDYLDYLRKDVELDREKFANMSESERMASIALGSGLVLKATSERIGTDITPDFVVASSKCNLGADDIVKIAGKFKEHNISSTNDFAPYLKQELPEDRIDEVGNAVKEGLREIHPEMTDRDIRNEIISMRREINTDNQ